MMLLDTNILSEPLRKIPDRKVHGRLAVHAGNFAASVITLHELRFGAMLEAQSVQLWTKIETSVVPLVHWVEVSEAIALQAADLKAHLGKRGRTVATNDCLIAATALVRDWVLVTRNTDDFKHMPGIQLENWFK